MFFSNDSTDSLECIFASIDGISYILNNVKGEASVNKNQDGKKNIFIPYSIQYKSKEYIVTSINQNAFFNDNKTEHIKFAPNSEIRLIPPHSFQQSTLQSIEIPVKVTMLGESSFTLCQN